MKRIPDDRWIRSGGGLEWRVDGKTWYEHYVPYMWHRCEPVTARYTAGIGTTLEYRCACGGRRIGSNRWTEKNSRVKARRSWYRKYVKPRRGK